MQEASRTFTHCQTLGHLCIQPGHDPLPHSSDLFTQGSSTASFWFGGLALAHGPSWASRCPRGGSLAGSWRVSLGSGAGGRLRLMNECMWALSFLGNSCSHVSITLVFLPWILNLWRDKNSGLNLRKRCHAVGIRRVLVECSRAHSRVTNSE